MYGGGKIYHNFDRCTFRVYHDYAHSRNDMKINWQGWSPSADEWQRALGIIDNYSKS